MPRSIKLRNGLIGHIAPSSRGRFGRGETARRQARGANTSGAAESTAKFLCKPALGHLHLASFVSQDARAAPESAARTPMLA